MKKILFLIYGLIAYIIFFGTYCYAVGFVTNLVVPAGLDSRPTFSLGFVTGNDSGGLPLKGTWKRV
jgi:hypothetical protein